MNVGQHQCDGGFEHCIPYELCSPMEQVPAQVHLSTTLNGSDLARQYGGPIERQKWTVFLFKSNSLFCLNLMQMGKGNLTAVSL